MDDKQCKLCGLDEQKISKFINILEAVSHTVDEEDWDDEERMKLINEGMKDLKELTDIITKAGCTSPPHGLIDPDEELKFLERCIKDKDVIGSTKAIRDLMITLFSDL